ncbi:hypothetical protein QC281_39770 [Streptomyces sp. DH17]|nr:hypothetical protein [Streptomyces sp. DH17]
MSKVYIVGIGMTEFGKFIDKSVTELAREAVDEALVDSELGPGDIQAAFFSNTAQGTVEGQHLVRGQIALRASD